jgi:hypothetical protein
MPKAYLPHISTPGGRMKGSKPAEGAVGEVAGSFGSERAQMQ